MRLPALRLPRGLSFDWLGRLGGRLTLLYIGYTAVLFAVFLLLTFPYEPLVRSVLSGINRGPVSVDVTGVRFAWLNGLELTGMRVSPPGDGHTPYLECSRLWVWPALGALVRGNPYDLLMNAELYGGNARGEIWMADGGVRGALHWRDADVGRYRTVTSLLDEGQVNGRLSGQLEFETRAGKPEASQVSGEVLLEAATLVGAKINGFGVPDIRFRQAKVKFTLRGDRLELQEFTATGDVGVQASGHMVLRDPLTESVLNVRATIEQSLATPDAIKGLVALIPRAPGSKPDAPISVSGTLGRPRVR